MNSEKHAHSAIPKTQRGNALIYILLALALLGALTMMMARTDDASDNLDYEKTELLTTRMTAYAGGAKNVIDQMIMSGANINNLNFSAPNSASFDAAGTNMYKVYHPDGGGLAYELPDPNLFTGTSAVPPPGWYMGRFNNVQWTPTASNDIVMAAFGISQSVCANINKKTTGATSIPALAGTGNPATYFVNTTITGVANAAFTNAVCAACEGYPSLCVSSSGGTYFTYYSIISGQ